MSLNIKNERVHALAREAARRTGKSQTSVIEEALERLLADLSQEDDEVARRARLDALMREIEAETTDADREATRRFMQEMYDEHGLPR
jgi:antitoxin VapB